MADEIGVSAEALLPHPTEILVEKWRTDHLPGLVVARDAECRNTVHGAKEALRALSRRI